MLLFVLNQNNIELSRCEAVSLLDMKEYGYYDKYILADFKFDDKIRRLAYTKQVYSVIFEAGKKNLKTKIDSHDWNKTIKKTYAIRTHDTDMAEIELADMIYHRLKNPKVDLEKPDLLVTFIGIKNKIYCCELIYENNEGYEERSAHKRPMLSPNSMNPRLARAMVNIANSKEITDPFCGTGGILIEAGLCKMESFGYDIDPKQLGKTAENLKFYKIKNCTLSLGDATKLKSKTEAIVTDPPYGKNTKLSDKLEKLYFNFLKNSEKITKKIVTTFPDNVHYKKIIKKTRWKIIAEFDYYIHKSMTKKVVVLENNN